MKTIATSFVCAVVLGIAVTGGAAQGVTIDTTDVKAMFAVGTTTVYRIDTLTTSVNIGGPGQSAWDFSGLLYHNRMRMMSVNVASTPYDTGFFSTATNVLNDTAFTYSFYDQTYGTILLKGKGYNYLAMGTDLKDYGIIGSGSAFIELLGPTGYPASGQWLKSPPAVYFALPLAFLQSWTTSYNEILSGSAQVGIFPVVVGPDTTAHKVACTVDAYGPLTVPGFPTVDALRIRKVDTLVAGLRVSYMFIAKDGTSVQFTAADPGAADNGTIAIVRGSAQWTAATAPHVEVVDNLPAAFGLQQNYPNPFNPSTTIRFTLPVREYVTLRVYNLLGQEVATLVNETLDAGESMVRFNGSRLSSGVYLYRLQAGGSTLTRRMTLVK